MANWTYLNVEFTWSTLTARQNALNVQGALGWELVSATDFKELSSNGAATVFTCRATFKKFA